MHQFHLKTIATAFLCAALLGACASVPTGQGPISSSAVLAPYQANFETAGRLSVNYKQKGSAESLTGKFTWMQTPARLDVTLSSPLATIATITVTPESATLVQSNKAPRVASDIDALTAQSLGWSLPVAGLRDWLQGYATDAQGKRFAASPANNHVFTRDGWNLRFTKWQDKPGPNGAPLPKTIRAERSATATSGDLSIVITIFPEG